jgi:endo-beta-N-acetylglucosaminidase D
MPFLNAPNIAPITTLDGFRHWDIQQRCEDSVAKIPLAQRAFSSNKPTMPLLIGCDMGEFQYDPYFTQWSRGCAKMSDTRTAANVFNFKYWQYVDISYYYGHNLVTIPPTVWTNAAHKNGVRSFGTLNLNWYENGNIGSQDAQRALWTPKPADANPDYIYLEECVKLLAQIAAYFRFDGYLLNYEPINNIYDPADRNPCLLLLKTCRAAGLDMIWYDSPTSAEKNKFDNALTENGLPFLQTAGMFQANYFWSSYFGNIQNPRMSWEVLQQHYGRDQALIQRDNTFMGIDCATERYTPAWDKLFWQNMAAMIADPNIPGDPPGYLTALNIYYPAWMMYDARKDPKHSPEDKLPNREDFLNDERAFWTGDKDYINFVGGNPVNRAKSVSGYIAPRTVITQLPFVTDFNDGEGDFYCLAGKPRASNQWNHLSDQSILPTFLGLQYDAANKQNQTGIVHSDAFYGGSSLMLDFTDVSDYFEMDMFAASLNINQAITLNLIAKGQMDAQALAIVLYFADNPSVTLLPVQANQTPTYWTNYAYQYTPPGPSTIVKIGVRVTLPQPVQQLLIGKFLIDGYQGNKPSIQRFSSDQNVLSWKGLYPDSHYRIFGLLNGENILLATVYNTTYQVAYDTSSGRVEADHIFNPGVTGFSQYFVQEVTKWGNYTVL